LHAPIVKFAAGGLAIGWPCRPSFSSARAPHRNFRPFSQFPPQSTGPTLFTNIFLPLFTLSRNMSDLPMPPLSKQQMQEAKEAFKMFDKVRQVQSACTDNALDFCAGYYFVNVI
jgi:hypothetical protein